MSRIRALAGAALLLGGCSQAAHLPTYRGASLVLISIDTLRSDHLPAYGYRGVATPAIDRLRHDGILCRRAYSNVPLTLPSHVSILSGELPPVHGVRDNAGYAYHEGASPGLASLLRRAGYATAAMVSAVVLRPGSGIESGFDVYDSPGMAGARATEVERSGRETLAVAKSWLQGNRGRSFFLFFHLYEPHAPYRPPPPFASRYAANPYDGEIATADGAVGDLIAELERLGLYDRALVVLLGDHGEGLGDHGERGHGMFLYRESLQVPLLIKLPGSARAGQTIEEPVELVDVYPTVTQLLAVAPGASALRGGRSVLGPRSMQERPLYAETFFPRLHFGWSGLVSLIRGRYHLQDGPEPELFDLTADPGEAINLVARERRVASAARLALRGFARELQLPAPMGAETARQLQSLGYLVHAVDPRGSLPDPRGRRAVIGELEEGLALSATGAHAEAARHFASLVAADPNLLDGWDDLGHAAAAAGDHQQALVAFQKGLELSRGAAAFEVAVAGELLALGRLDDARRHLDGLSAGSSDAAGLLARIDLAQGDLDAARRHLDAAGDDHLRRRVGAALLDAGRAGDAVAVLLPLSGSEDPATIDALAVALTRSSRAGEAVALLERSLARHGDDAPGLETLGVARLQLEEVAGARETLEKALALDPRRPVAWNTLGVTRYRLGDPRGAIQAWQRAVALDPRQYDALFNLGLVAAEVGQRQQAGVALRRFISAAPSALFAGDIAKARAVLARMG